MQSQPVNALAYLQSFLDGLRDRIPTCHAVLVTDSDGVVLLKSVDSSSYQENSLDATLSAVYVKASFSLSLFPRLIRPLQVLECDGAGLQAPVWQEPLYCGVAEGSRSRPYQRDAVLRKVSRARACVLASGCI